MDDRREYREQHVPRPRTLLLRILRAATVPSLPAGGKFRFAPRRYLRTTESRGKHPETDGNDPAELPSVPLQRGAASPKCHGLQPGNLWQRLVLPRRIDHWSLTSLQQRPVKTGGRLVKHARYYWLLLAESHLTWRLFQAMVGRIAGLPVATG